MTIQFADLRPYRSLLLCDAPARWRVTEALEELRTIVESVDSVTNVSTASAASRSHGVSVQFFSYRVEQTPMWLASSLLTNHTHELVVVFRKARMTAILMTEARLREQIRSHFATTNNTRIGELTPVPAGELNSAYVKGKTSTLWLTGTHRRVPSQADNKTLSGPDLLYALDPLGDQSYYFTGAVSKLPGHAYSYNIGVSPTRSYIWGGPSANASEMCKGVAQLFDILNAARSTPNLSPLPILASPATDVSSLRDVASAYEAALIPSELLGYDCPPDVRTHAERWSKLEFEIVAANGLTCDAALSLADANGSMLSLGTIRIAFDTSAPGRIRWTATQLTAAPGPHQQSQAEAIQVINSHKAWLKVWFESGHTLVDQQLFSVRLRDAQFTFCFCDFRGYRINVEKPSPLRPNTIGTQGSLFCWVQQAWHRGLPNAGAHSGWLACNDGAMEIADFIHFDSVNGQNELSLIHVKAANTNSTNRQLSVADYEVVVGQAVKNLRFLDHRNTLAEFTASLNGKLLNASWQGGTLDTRARMMNAMRLAAPPPKRRVIIVQPRVRRSALIAARNAAQTTTQHRIARQLDTLLLAAQANCRNLGAELIVIADQS